MSAINWIVVMEAMMQDDKTPDVSYVTELQRRWIERTYGSNWDKVQTRAFDIGQWTCLEVSGYIPLASLIGGLNDVIESVPANDRHKVTVGVVKDNDGGCHLSFKYNRLETEHEFNQRIAGYLHRWEKLKDIHEREKATFN